MRKYRPKKSNSHPENVVSHLKLLRKCVLGISLGTTRFEEGPLSEMMAFVDSTADHCLCLIGDGIHRHNIEGNARADAEILDRDLGTQMLSVCRRMACKCSSCRFDFCMCSEIQKTDEYLRFHRQVIKAFDGSKKLREFIHDDAVRFVSRGGGQVHLAEKYIVEEIAVFSTLVKEEWLIMVYPNEDLRTLRAAAEGQFGGLLPDQLSKRGFIRIVKS